MACRLIDIPTVVVEPIEPTPLPTPSPMPIGGSANAQGQIVERLEDYNIETRTELIDYMMKVEPFEAKTYKADKNEKYYTIGYGHYCDDPAGTDAEYLQPGYVMTKEEGMAVLIQDLKDHVPNDILTVVYGNGVQLYDYQIDVLTSVRFSNKDFTLSKSPNFTSYLMNGIFNEKDTLSELITYVKSGDAILGGSVKRRIAEAMIFSGYGYPQIEGDSLYDDSLLIGKLYKYANDLVYRFLFKYTF